MIKLVNDLMSINKLSSFNVPLRSDRAMAIWNLISNKDRVNRNLFAE
jgi:hypothetical protein